MSRRDHVHLSEEEQDVLLLRQKELNEAEQKEENLRQLEAWEKLLGFFIENDFSGMCFTLVVMHVERIISSEEKEFLDNEIWRDIPQTSLNIFDRFYMFPLEDKESRINYIKSKINALKSL